MKKTLLAVAWAAAALNGNVLNPARPRPVR